MQIDIPQTIAIGERIGRVSADARSYVKSIEGTTRQALSSNEGFGSIRQLGHTLDTLAGRVDGLLGAADATSRGIITAAQRYSVSEDRNRCAIDGLSRQLETLTGGGPAGAESASTDSGGRTALASAPPVSAPASLGGLETISQRVQTGLGRFGNVSSWISDVHYGRFAPRGANGRFTSPTNMTAWQRAVAGANGEFRAIPNHSSTRAAWTSAGTWAGRIGTGLNVVTKTADQAAKDWNNPNLTGDQRVARAGWRGAVEGGGAWGGGAAGAKIGAGLGTLVAPGVGTVIGGAVGGILGGIAGATAGQWIADRTVDDAGDIFERITPW